MAQIDKIKHHHLEDGVHKNMPKKPNKSPKTRQRIKHAIPQYVYILYRFVSLSLRELRPAD